jgi:hypothetical protein
MRLAVVREELHRIVVSSAAGRQVASRIPHAVADHHHDGYAARSDTGAVCRTK